MTMIEPGAFTRTEILSQPDAWQAALAVLREQAPAVQRFVQAGDFESVVFTGCGSTYYLSLAAAAALQEIAGRPARGLPASEIWLYPQSALPAPGRTLLVAVSRSGETTETLRACEAFRAAGGRVLTLSCYPGRPLTHSGQLNLVFPSGQEESIAQTRAFTTLYVAVLALASLWRGAADSQPVWAGLRAAWEASLPAAVERAAALGRDDSIDRFYFLGSGSRHGLACELSLKMKEMSLSHSEPFHFMEFRHGPKSMVTPGTLIVGLMSDSRRSHEEAVLADLAALGGRTLTIGEQDADVALHSGLPEALRGPLYLPPGQLLAFERSRHKGLDPDRPHNLEAVVKL
jgi:glucosamine--fructose-6-phosphate aminotransferase (isomerizing)